VQKRRRLLQRKMQIESDWRFSPVIFPVSFIQRMPGYYLGKPTMLQKSALNLLRVQFSLR
jgi:hypothetical protein